ncbi:acetoacetyl-CoA reductase [Luteimonas sp. MJ293]|uniref:acetoacetyl-CoA reductase n=1 Tax=Luteimonas sp. MJ146 TaxID=3129240 RepID=UPI0031BA782A
MSKRIAVVTGGIGGLGSAICVALARAGRTVIATDLGGDAERIDSFERKMDGLDVSFSALDVADHEACAAFVADVEDRHGTLDILVNGAGITRDVTLRKMDRQQWQQVIDVNLGGVFNMCQPAIEGMSARGFGRVVNISSVNGQTGQFGQANYSAAKAGMHGFTMAMAREGARKGVTVNSVSPGYCETALVMAMPQQVRDDIVSKVPAGRLGQPEEIARAVEFLTADEAGFITGANLPVNGGLFISF